MKSFLRENLVLLSVFSTQMEKFMTSLFSERREREQESEPESFINSELFKFSRLPD
jgi:hypothetical protein